MNHLFKRTVRLLREEDAATAIEYAVMVSLIAVAVIASVGQVASRTKDTFNTAGNAVNSALSP